MTAFTFVGGVEHDKDIEPPAAARKRLPVTRQSARQIKAVLAKIDFVTSAGARIVTALFCLIAASSVSPADADEGPAPQPEPFGVFENREEAFCRSTDMQGESHCVCSAAGVEVPMTFSEFAYYIRLRISDPGTARAVEAKLAQWARYCEPNR